MMIDLPTASEVSKYPPDFRAKIAKASRSKGSNYERDVAKKIAAYFGEPWDSCSFRTKPHGMAQPNGDIQPINQMYERWKSAKLGPLECKNRNSWSFDQIFKNAEKSELYRYWEKSNKDTNRDDTVLIFTKNGVSDLVMTLDKINYIEPNLFFNVNQTRFVIQTLKNFLLTNFLPK